MDRIKDSLIDMLDGCEHPGKETLVMQILNTKNPNKYIDVVERITHKHLPQPQLQSHLPPLDLQENLMSGFIEPLMLRMLQSQLSSIIGDQQQEPSEKKSMKYGSITREKACCICKNDFTEKDDVIFRKCEHMFHEDCLFEWENSGNPNAKKCPVCRAD